MTEKLSSRYEVGDLIEVKLDSIAFGGEAVGRLDGLVVFVQGGIDGERVRAEVVQAAKAFLRAKVVEVLEPSPHRVQPPCPVFGRCGGCQYQHIAYEHQLEVKEAQVRESLERIGRITRFELEPILASPQPYEYRSRVDFHVTEGEEGLKIGFVASDGRQILDVNHCPISAPAINEAYRKMRSEIRSGLFAVPPWVQEIKFWETATGPEHFFLNHHGRFDLRGKEYVEIKVSGRTFKIPPLSFFQVNRAMIEKLVSSVERFLDLKGDEFLLDAYSGVGLFAVSLAPKVKFCVGVESDPAAGPYARINALENGVHTCEFLDGSVEKILKHWERFLKTKPAALILDPPRSGCTKKVLEALAVLAIPRIVYVSCDPATLARDIAFLSQNGYTLEKVQPLDLFPQTKHCEIVSALVR